MRYDGALVEKDVHKWAVKNFKNPIKVYSFRGTFVVTTEDDIINIEKDSGAIEVKDK